MNNNSFIKIAVEKVADDFEFDADHPYHTADTTAKLKAVDDEAKALSLANSDALERMRAGEGGFNTIMANAKEYGHRIKDWFTGAHHDLDKLIKDHPTTALGAGLGAGAVGAGGILGGLFSRSKAKSNRALEAAANSRISALSGKTKALALLAALGIPASAAATYFATRDKRK